MEIEILQRIDGYGSLEEFTWDLYPLIDAKYTEHLNESGLPKIGTRMQTGMIVVGKIGKTVHYDPQRQPTSLEIQGLDRESVNLKYGHMWTNTSIYADSLTEGVVEESFFVNRNGQRVAIVRLR